MSKEDRIWREGDQVWEWPEGETVPRYKWSQFPKSEIVDLLNQHGDFKGSSVTWIAAIIVSPECDTSVIGCCDDDVFECRHYSEGVFFDNNNKVIDVDFWMPKPDSPYQTGQIKA